ncbi:hypothetical protein MNBD_DELTA03-878 [hydrothermal vent metagenome]|uniref:Uncharacterized protein n=1 Tax=hydrothermal vent metagenome TaxID=652676 RepID=A0A3B0VJY9_9ZZZZ
MPKNKRQLKTGRGGGIKILVLLILALLLIFVLYKTVFKNQAVPRNWFVHKIETPPPAARMPAVISSASPKTAEAEPPPAPPVVKKELSPCEMTSTEINTFFKHLEQQEYIKAYELHEPIGVHLNKIVIKLLNNPPIVAGETNNLFTVLKNTAHFYRVLGPKDLSLLRDILKYENNDLEHLLNLFYSWSKLPGCKTNGLNLQLPLPKLYEHAAFFLNTLGGQSYLFRRDSRLRTLIRYYSILIIDRAIKKNENKYHITLPARIKALIKSINTMDDLDNQEQYLNHLRNILSSLTPKTEAHEH